MIYFLRIAERTLFFSSSIFLLVLAGNKVSAQQYKPLQQRDTLNVKINLEETFQTIDNFGASDAWSCQFVGNWPDAGRKQVADLLFSQKIKKDGSPKGIGLSLWRFNLGAGSAQQGPESGIRDEWRRAAGFLRPDGHYDWKAQSGQLWFLKAARKRGVEKFLAFTNSPPVQMTKNGKAYADNGKVNISAAKYPDFADFLTRAIKGVSKETRVNFDYVSPVNEPQWEWSDGGQEGCPYANTEVAGLVRSISKSFDKANLNTKILIGEAGKIDYLFMSGDKPGKGKQIRDFFDVGSKNYIGDLPGVMNVISAHSYFTTSPTQAGVKSRMMLRDSVADVKGLSYWQSEYCVLGDNAGEINGNKRDLGINSALYVAGVIHMDLTVANAAAWQWWTAVSAYDYKDGLVYIDKKKDGGNVYPSKILWALGNYSRFIRPGAVRVATGWQSVVDSAESKPLLVSAFKKGKDFTAVFVNRGSTQKTVHLSFARHHVKFKMAFITSSSDALKAVRMKGDLQILPAKSIVTLTGRIRKANKD
ncbi:MAG TPA: glycoside hydrolase [Arachidicoccus sp.]|nr:glycoside hydrolase [Arachidicoccus sp.]